LKLQPRVLLISGQAERYGADRALRTLAEGWQGRGWDVMVAVPGPGPLVDDLAALGIPTTFVDPAVIRRMDGAHGMARLVGGGAIRSALRVRRLIRRWEPDVVYVNAVVIVGGLLGAVWSGRPTVCHIRESFADHRSLWRAYGKLLRRLPVRLIAVSTGIAQEAEDAGLGGQTVMIHDGVQFREVDDPRRIVERRPGIVCIGRINDSKGQDDLVCAARLLRDHGITAPVLFAGDVFPGGESHREHLVDLIDKQGMADQVQLLGWIDDPTSLLDTWSIYVQPTARPEPFGLALVDAMAAGMACVATDAGGPRDIIRNGETGLLVPPRRPEDLAAAIERLWRDDELRQSLGRAASADVRERFSASRNVERCEEVLRQAIAGRSRRRR